MLDQIKTSNLNFHLQMSPFSAIISMKKSPVKDKSGALLLPQAPILSSSKTSESTIAALAAKNLQLEADLRSLRNDHSICVEDCEAAYRKIKVLESQPAVHAEIKLEADLAASWKLIAAAI